MIGLVYPSITRFNGHSPGVLEIGELEDYNFNEVSEYIYSILDILAVCNIIRKRYNSPEEVLEVIHRLIKDIDFEDYDSPQSSELGNVRAVLHDDLFFLEVCVGV